MNWISTIIDGEVIPFSSLLCWLCGSAINRREVEHGDPQLLITFHFPMAHFDRAARFEMQISVLNENIYQRIGSKKEMTKSVNMVS